jgi:hypothetical protein
VHNNTRRGREGYNAERTYMAVELRSFLGSLSYLCLLPCCLIQIFQMLLLRLLFRQLFPGLDLRQSASPRDFLHVLLP